MQVDSERSVGVVEIYMQKHVIWLCKSDCIKMSKLIFFGYIFSPEFKTGRW